ncbi:MAG: hypothetical protein ACRDRR_08545, partial [Pseudonocardiaceae bacterium]
HRKIKPHTSRSQRDRHAHVADRRINTPTAALQPRSAHGLNGYVALLPSHDYSHVPLGKGQLFERGDEAIVKARFNLAIPSAVDWFEALKFDMAHPPSLQEFSYGYTVLDGGSRMGTHAGQRVRFLQPLKGGSPGAAVHEVSMVLLGAGVGTRLVSVKRSAPHTELSGADAEQLQRIRLRGIRDRSAEGMQADALRQELSAIAAKHSHHYSEDKESAVPEASWHAARAATDTYSVQLGIKRPRIRWFSAEDDPEYVEFSNLRPLLGKADLYRDQIWLRRDLDPADAWSIAAHECRHLAGGDEDEALTYEAEARSAWGCSA